MEKLENLLIIQLLVMFIIHFLLFPNNISIKVLTKIFGNYNKGLWIILGVESIAFIGVLFTYVFNNLNQ